MVCETIFNGIPQPTVSGAHRHSTMKQADQETLALWVYLLVGVGIDAGITKAQMLKALKPSKLRDIYDLVENPTKAVDE